jgi:hypothetical protein
MRDVWRDTENVGELCFVGEDHQIEFVFGEVGRDDDLSVIVEKLRGDGTQGDGLAVRPLGMELPHQARSFCVQKGRKPFMRKAGFGGGCCT